MRRRAAYAVAALLAVAALASCAGLRAAGETRDALRAQGHDVRNVGFTNGPVDVVSVTFRPAQPTPEAATAEAHAIAAVVWTVTPYRFDVLDLVVVGLSLPGLSTSERTRASYAELEQEFGPRPVGLDDKSLGEVIDGRAVAAVLAVLAVLGVGGTVLIVVLVRQSRRNRRPQWGAYPMPWPPPQGYPPQGYPPPTWPPPPPADPDNPFSAPPA